MRKSQSGFGLPEFIIVLALLFLVAAIGYKVWSENKHNETGSVTLSSQNQTTNWKQVKSQGGQMSVGVPNNWTTSSCQDTTGSSTADVIDISSPKGHKAACGYYSSVTLSLASIADQCADKPSDQSQNQVTQDGVTVTKISLNGIGGLRISSVSTVSDQKVTTVSYEISGKEKCYTAVYSLSPGDDFDQALIERVIQTWKF